MKEKEFRNNTNNKTIYNKRIEHLLKTVQELSAARDLETIMDIIRHAARELTGAQGATFVLKDQDQCYYVEEDAISPLWKGKRFPMDICISGWAMIHKEPAVIEDIYKDNRVPIDVYRKTFVHSLVTVPIKTKDPIGAIGCYWKDQHQASSEEIKIMQMLADTAAIAMDNVSYQENIETQAQQLSESLESTLLAIAKMVEQKDLYTSGHQNRTAKISKDIACAMGLDIETCNRVYQAASVHDIGKIGIPSSILSKPAQLSQMEYELIKTHTQAGFDILKESSIMRPIANILLQHHERLDGSGYPYGLTNENIMREAKIVSVADVYESMTSDRPYRKALEKDVALDELISHKGTRYSTEVVDALVRLVKENDY